MFWVGNIRFAPGTIGSLVTAIIYFLLPTKWFYENGVIDVNSYIYMLLVVVAISLLSVYLTTKAESVLGHDNKRIVLDEFCGMMLSFLFLPKTIMTIVYCFVLFRVFDIAKPFPINKSQAMKGGWGIVIDDLLAGIYTNVLLQILLLVSPKYIKFLTII